MTKALRGFCDPTPLATRVPGEGLDALVVAKDLSRGRCRHGRQQQGIPKAVYRNFRL